MSYTDSFRAMQIPSNTYDVNIIHQDDPNTVYGNIEKRLIIDSRDRNYKNYPKSSNYIIKLNEQFRNITSIELTRAQIPQSGYTINNNNNIIHVNENNECYRLEVPIGDYTINDLVNKLNSVFCSSHLENKYKISYNKNIGKIIFNSSGEFQLNFKGSVHLDNTHAGFKRLYPPNSMGKLLGFNPEIYGNEYGGFISSISEETIDSNLFDYNKLCCCPSLLTTIDSPEDVLKITGDGTCFSTTFSPCDYIYIYDADGNESVFLVLYVEEDDILYAYHLTKVDIEINTCNCYPEECYNYDSNYDSNTFDDTNEEYVYIGKAVIAPNKYDLFYNRYLVLHIKELERLRSKETSVMDSFAIIPLNDKSNSLINIDASKYPTSKEIKYFTPPLGKLDRLTIQFLTYDGYEYDFNGIEHYLDLRINMLNQQGKYLNM